MHNTFIRLVQRDHDDIASAFAIILAPQTTSEMLRDAIDAMKLGFTVHAIAEQRVLASLVKNRPSFAITEIARQARVDHITQERCINELTSLVSGCRSWNKSVLELRSKMMRHALDTPCIFVALEDALAPWPVRQLASRYATERMRVLAETLPARLESAS